MNEEGPKPLKPSQGEQQATFETYLQASENEIKALRILTAEMNKHAVAVQAATTEAPSDERNEQIMDLSLSFNAMHDQVLDQQKRAHATLLTIPSSDVTELKENMERAVQFAAELSELTLAAETTFKEVIDALWGAEDEEDEDEVPNSN